MTKNIEIDEIYFGGKNKNKHSGKKIKNWHDLRLSFLQETRYILVVKIRTNILVKRLKTGMT